MIFVDVVDNHALPGGIVEGHLMRDPNLALTAIVAAALQTFYRKHKQDR